MTTKHLTLAQAVDEAFDGCNATLKANIVKYFTEALVDFGVYELVKDNNGLLDSPEILQDLLDGMVYDDNYNISVLSEWVPERFLGVDGESDEFEWMNVEDMNKTTTTLTRMPDHKEVDIVEAWWKL